MEGKIFLINKEKYRIGKYSEYCQAWNAYPVEKGSTSYIHLLLDKEDLEKVKWEK